MKKQIALGACLAAGAALMIAAGAQPERDAQRAGQDDGAAMLQQMGQRLVAGLEAIEGCLGVETPEFSGGRQCIMAWFENKAAVERWYYSPTHQFMMRGAQGGVPGAGESKPLAHVEDEDIPIMVMATINFSGKPATPGPIPFSEISIELYTPLPGGAFIAKRLAPESLEIPHMKDFTPQPEDG
ncbi:MAG: hypothetical protein RIB60_10330 [Phycisphaerales bacterium]